MMQQPSPHRPINPPSIPWEPLIAGIEDEAIVLLNPEGIILSWNLGAQQIFGYTAAEMVGQSLEPLYPIAEREQQPQQHLAIARHQGRYREETWKQRKDAQRFLAHTSLTAQHNEAGELLGFALLVRDITGPRQQHSYYQLLERALAASANAITISDPNLPDNPLIFVNRRFEQMTGYSLTEAIGKNCRYLHGEDTEQPGLTTLRTAIAHQTDCCVTLRNYRKDGTLFWNELRISPVLNNQGELTHFIGVQSDVTERIAVEQRLQHVTQAVEAASDAIAIADPSGEILYHNRAFRRLFSDRPDQLPSHYSSLYTDPQEATTVLTLMNQGQTCSREVRMKSPHSPQPVSIFLRANPLQDEQGHLNGWIAIHTDITEQKKAEAALRQGQILQEREQRNQLLLAAIPDTILRLNRQGILLDYRASHQHLWGQLAENALGQSLLQLLPLVVAAEMIGRLKITLDTGQPQVVEYDLPAGDGNSRTIPYEARFVLAGGDEVLVILRDITERKQIDRLKNEFVSIVSHELRTPLTSVRGSLSLVTGGVAGEIPSQAKALIEIAVKNTERLILLINDILDIEKIESGKMDFNLEKLEIQPLVEQAIADNQPFAEQFSVHLQLEQTLPNAIVKVDRDRLLQVFTNLLSNAAKFSPPQAVVSVRIFRHQQKIRIEVSDHGSGIPEEFRPRIFQKFVQADASIARRKGGTGLGLSICKAIVEHLGGTIGFKTETLVGTTFYIELPEVEIPNIAPASPYPLSQKSDRLLICEDDRDIAKLLSLMLEKDGFVTDIAYSAQQAKTLLTQHTYTMMTLDLALPDQDGISLLRELRHDPKTQHLPIIVVSANAEVGKSNDESCFAVIDWLEKPIDQQRLLAAIHTAHRSHPGEKPQVLQVEDDPDLVQVVTAILRDYAIVEAASTLQTARQKLQQHPYDLVILDLNLPDGSGFDLLPELNCHPLSPIPAVIFSANEVSLDLAKKVSAALVKSRTSNQQLLNTIKSLISKSLIRHSDTAQNKGLP